MPEYFEIAKQRINDWQPPPQQELFDETCATERNRRQLSRESW